ncbi:MAG: asparagine synthase (glutamine-hydrolyzing) [Bacteroidia bacterium]
MCGISGLYLLNDKKINQEYFKRFTDSMIHRGPDGSGYEYFDEHCLALGQRRLSILDLSSAGKQPMSYADGRYWITYNGEIFNFSELKKELIAKGFSFKSETDTEIILAAFIAWGKDCLSKFNGMWAFAIWDNIEKQLFMARDRFGIKPFYYLFQPGIQLVFASETRAFKYLEGFRRERDEYLLNLNLLDNYAIEGLGHTIFKQIKQILPGHYVVFKKGNDFVQKRWWHISDYDKQDVPKTLEEQAEKFYDLFRDACRLRLISDVPVATALSGGLDSTAVYSTVYDILKTETLGRVNKDSQRAFSAIFPGLIQDERAFAESAVKFTGGKLDLIETNYDSLISDIVKETELSDFLLTSPITAISSVYKGMRNNGITVSMDGHGVDEMLYGYRDMVYNLFNYHLNNGEREKYSRYREVLVKTYHSNNQKSLVASLDRAERMEQGFKSLIKRRLKSLARKAVKKEIDRQMNYLPQQMPENLGQPYDFSNKLLPERMVYHEFFEHCLPALLRNFDRASMMNSVEIRMPFMDWRLVSYVFSLPTESKIGKGFTKLLVREAMNGKMEESLRTRTYKVGIGSPIDCWMEGPLKEWSNDLLKKIDRNITKNIGDIEQFSNIEKWKLINISLIS